MTIVKSLESGNLRSGIKESKSVDFRECYKWLVKDLKSGNCKESQSGNFEES